MEQKLNSEEVIIWPGRQDDSHQGRVALIINRKQTGTLLQWKPTSLPYVRTNLKDTKLSVSVAHDPSDKAEEEEKDHFYSMTQAALDDVPKHDRFASDG